MFSLIFEIARGAGEGEESIMTCSGLDCDLCKLLEMVNNTLDQAIAVSSAVAILFSIIGGFVYIGARGNDVWMSQAKRTVKVALMGFAFVLVANLSVKVIFQITGATDNFFSFDCNVDGVATKENLKNIKKTTASQIASGTKSGGSTGGQLEGEISSGEVASLFNGISEQEIVFFGSKISQEIKPFIGLGKTSGNPEIVYLNNNLINMLLKNKLSLENISLMPNKVSAADGGLTDQGEKVLASVYQIVSQIQNKGNEVIVFTSKKPKETKEGTETKVSVNDFLKDFNDTTNCLMSGGEWFKFGSPCSLEKEKCNGVSCSESSGGSTVYGCNCPDDKCMDGNICSPKSGK